MIVFPHAAGSEGGAEDRASCFLCDASPIPSRRLRDLAVRRADPESSLVAKDVRIWNLGRRNSAPSSLLIPGDIVAQEHWCSSGFANTDLDLILKRHGIQKLIVIGLIAHTCVESTVRFAAELGYDVTVVKDATADYSDEEFMHAALVPISQTTPARSSQRRKSPMPFQPAAHPSRARPL